MVQKRTSLIYILLLVSEHVEVFNTSKHREKLFGVDHFSFFVFK